jgi:Acyl-CoA reductase (LuxC)
MNSSTWQTEIWQERVNAVAAANAGGTWLGQVGSDEIWDWLTLEFGPAGLPGQTKRYGNRTLRSFPYSPIYHIVAGNTPHAAIQSLTRGILVGAVNRIKIPSAGLPELEHFASNLPEKFRPEIDRELVPPWLEEAEALVVFGSDETIHEFARRVAPWQRFIPHGNRISFSLVLGNYDNDLIRQTARDFCAFDQLGCLSPQFCLVNHNPRTFCELLAEELKQAVFDRVEFAVASVLRSFREEWSFRAAQFSSIGLWQSEGSLDWTILLDPAPGIPRNPLYRTIIVKPWSDERERELALIRRWISTISISPQTESNLEFGLRLGAQRICSPGAMQNPPLTWHHDGLPPLRSLVRYVDVEADRSDRAL